MIAPFCTDNSIYLNVLTLIKLGFLSVVFSGEDQFVRKYVTFDMIVLYGNDAFSILVLSTKNQYSSFLKKVFVFQKVYFKVTVLKTFKVSSVVT